MTVKELMDRKITHRGVYHDVGVVLDSYVTQELFDFVWDNLNMRIALRDYLERQIIAYVGQEKKHSVGR